MTDPTGSSRPVGLGGETFSVGDLAATIGVRLAEAFPAEVWVRGQIADLSRAASGHVYFTLVDSNDDDDDDPLTTRPSPGRARRPPATAQLAVMLPKTNKQRVNRLLTRAGSTGVRMADGTEVRIRCRVDWFAPRGSLQLRMTSIDPAFTLGKLAADRALLLARLRTEGILAANARLYLDPAPMRVGLVTSAGSAAEADVLHTLDSSGFAFDIRVADVRVQGTEAPTSIAGAIGWFEAVDVIVVARGGGATSDLAAFDQEVVVRAIAAAAVPVITGIGHEVDRSVADEAAFHAAKTPTAAAAFLVDRVAMSFGQTEAAWAQISRRAEARLHRCDEDLGAALQRVRRAATSAAASELQRLDHRHHRLGRSAGLFVSEETRRLEQRSERLLRAARQHVSAGSRDLDSYETRLSAVDPARALARGWALLHDATGGIIRSVDELEPGAVVTTTLHDGTAVSVVRETHRLA